MLPLSRSEYYKQRSTLVSKSFEILQVSGFPKDFSSFFEIQKGKKKKNTQRASAIQERKQYRVNLSLHKSILS